MAAITIIIKDNRLQIDEVQILTIKPFLRKHLADKNCILNSIIPTISTSLILAQSIPKK